MELVPYSKNIRLRLSPTTKYRIISRFQVSPLFGGKFETLLSQVWVFAMDLREQKAMEATNSSINGKDGSQAGDLDANSTDTVRTWQEIFASSSDQHCGFVESIGKATELLKKSELETTTKFSCHKSDKMFGAEGETWGPGGGIPYERGVDACHLVCRFRILVSLRVFWAQHHYI